MEGLPGTVADAVLALTLVAAVFTDLRRRRIGNAITLPVMALGLLLHALGGGWAGLGWGVAGWLAGGALLLVPFVLGGTGAGDVKLLAAIGALKGPLFALAAGYGACAAGGLMALGFLGYRALTRRARAGAPPRSVPAARPARVAIPFAPAIAVGAFVALTPAVQAVLARIPGGPA